MKKNRKTSLNYEPYLLFKHSVNIVIGLTISHLLGRDHNSLIAFTSLLVMYVDRGTPGCFTYIRKRFTTQFLIICITCGIVNLGKIYVPQYLWIVVMVAAIVALYVATAVDNKFHISPHPLSIVLPCIIVSTTVAQTPGYFSRRIVYLAIGFTLGAVIYFLFFHTRDRYGKAVDGLQCNYARLQKTALDAYHETHQWKPVPPSTEHAFTPDHLLLLRSENAKNPKYDPKCIQPLLVLSTAYDYCQDVYKILGELGSSAQVRPEFLAYIQSHFAYACSRHEAIIYYEEIPSADHLPSPPGAQTREETLLEWYLDRYNAKLDVAAATPAQAVLAK